MKCEIFTVAIFGGSSFFLNLVLELVICVGYCILCFLDCLGIFYFIVGILDRILCLLDCLRVLYLVVCFRVLDLLTVSESFTLW